MSYYGSNVVAVNVKGSAETEFVSATFVAKVTTYGQTGPAAKDKALPTIDSIKKAVMQHAERAGIDTTRLKTSFSVDIHHDRHSGNFSGYKASYSITFTGRNVVESLALHDALTSIDGVESPTPVFNLNDSADVHSRAFNDAFQRAKVKFENQCRATGTDPKEFRLTSWSIQDEEPRGKMLSFREDGAGPKAVGLEPGKAVLDMRVTFCYSRPQAEE